MFCGTLLAISVWCRGAVPSFLPFITGLRPDFEICGDMRRVETFAKFLSKQVTDRDLINKPNALFFDCAVAQGKLNFDAPNGCFELVHEHLDEEYKEDEASPLLVTFLSSCLT